MQGVLQVTEFWFHRVGNCREECLGSWVRSESTVWRQAPRTGALVPRPALDGVIWGDGPQLPSTPSQCATALKLLPLKRLVETLTVSIFLNSWSFHDDHFVCEVTCVIGRDAAGYCIVRPRFTFLENRLKNERCFSWRQVITPVGLAVPAFPREKTMCLPPNTHVPLYVQCLNFSSSAKYEIILKWHNFWYSNKNQSGKENYMMLIILCEYKSAVKSCETPVCLGSSLAVQNNFQQTS